MKNGVSQDQDIFCRRCKYNLRGLPAGNCPECGRDFNPLHAETFLRSLAPEHPILDITFARHPLVWSGDAILAAQFVLFVGEGGFLLGMAATMLVKRLANECLALSIPLLILMWIVGRRIPQRQRSFLPMLFAICAALLCLCEIFAPGFAHESWEKVTCVGVSIALIRFSFGLWGAGLLADQHLQRVVLCCAANLVLLAAWLAMLISLASSISLALAVATSLPFLLLSWPAIRAGWTGLTESSAAV